MREFPLFIDGKDVEPTGWTYTIAASAMLRDITATFNLKRALELGRHTGEIPDHVVARTGWGDRELCQQAIPAAHRAAADYARLSLDTRLDIVSECHQAFIDNLDELVELLVAEGHPRRLALWEISGLIRQTDEPTLAWYRTQFDSSYFDGDCRVQLLRKPDGVVCVNPPQNAAGSNGALGIMALLAGNAIIVKAPRSTPMTVMHIYRNIVAPILDRHGAPSGTLNLVSGDSQQIMRDWLASPLVNDILFFGGSDVGLSVGRDCAAVGKKAVLELAGNDGFVVWADADLPAAARALSESFYGSSQICMVPKYCVLHPAIAAEFTELFLAIVRDIQPGFPEDPHTLLSPVLKSDQYFDFLSEATEAGCELLTGGRRVDVHGQPSSAGLFFEPTVLAVDGLARARKLSCVTEETFFPMLPLVTAEEHDELDLVEELITFLNANRYGLRNSLWVKSPEVARRFATGVVNGGQLKINDSHIAMHSYLASHGGTGRTGGPSGELNYVAINTSHLQGILWGNGTVNPLGDIETTAVPAHTSHHSVAGVR